MLRMPPAIFNRPSVSYQSLLSLIVAVTDCHVPVVFSHISSSPIFCKGGQSESLLPLTEAPFQDKEIGLFSRQNSGQLHCCWRSSAPRTAPRAPVYPSVPTWNQTKTNYHTLNYAHTECCWEFSRLQCSLWKEYVYVYNINSPLRIMIDWLPWDSGLVLKSCVGLLFSSPLMTVLFSPLPAPLQPLHVWRMGWQLLHSRGNGQINWNWMEIADIKWKTLSTTIKAKPLWDLSCVVYLCVVCLSVCVCFGL